MSYFQEKDDWWQGVDGKWYPPVARRVDASQTHEPEASVYLNQVRPIRWRLYFLYLMCMAVVAVAATGVYLYQVSKVEYKRTHFSLVLIDRIPESFGWSVRADCVGVPSERRFCQCLLASGYNDLNKSTPIILVGKSGKELARTTFEDERVSVENGEIGNRAIENSSQLPSSVGRKCEWSTYWVNFPDNEDYYVVKFGNRGEIRFELDDLTTSPMLIIEDD